jgi:hypothetical protein
MKFVLSIDCENAAFVEYELDEVARLLREVADRLESGDSAKYYRNILDVNGNVVGRYKMFQPGQE